MASSCAVTIPAGPITSVSLYVDAAHTYPADWRLSLARSDSGAALRLDNHTGKVSGVFDLGCQSPAACAGGVFVTDDRTKLGAGYDMSRLSGEAKTQTTWTVTTTDWYPWDWGVIRSMFLFVE
ncbi:MAG: hypothetical protein HY903_14400 [Deltaproteobacteria bacterium]|nr:hypothetical protein [Deltaproteobacteria bacterium]